ncbi:Bud site selection protein 6 [Knufia obscura]|uniref:Bud site selection protein 6 n=1 Tax=Knufia obscura TaxID=1635080 RepID=A0ABR0S2H9_9EURO|nr:Bud site selection protein 6 [Knufia obscura]
MQSSSSAASRTSQRRQGSTGTPEASAQPSAASIAMDQAQQQGVGGPQARSASGTSTRTHVSRSSNPDKQISQIEKSVTHLLVATKQLLETLTQWSRGNSQEEEVSDVYVRLGYEFNLACRAFNSIGVDTTDLGPVPDLLRSILEDTLSQPASPQALDNYLPRIRDIIINLLQGLKRKQSKLRQRPPKDGPTSSKPGQPPVRQTSTASAVSDVTSITLVDQPVTGRGDSPSMMEAQDASNQNTIPQPSMERSSLRRSIRREPQQQIPSSDSTSTMSSATAQNLPVLSPSSQAESNSSIVAGFPFAPPPPPKQDALTALQRGGDLERRASRRFSAYQIQKHLGASPNGVPVIPPAQNSPIPNRGREVRESMRAVTSRTSYQATRQKSSAGKLTDASPSRSGTLKHPQRISEKRDEPPSLNTQDAPRIEPPVDRSLDDSPTAKTPEEYRGTQYIDTVISPEPQLGATVNGPFSPTKENLGFEGIDGKQQQPGSSPERERDAEPVKRTDVQPASEMRSSATPPPTVTADLDSSPASQKELTLFLQYKTRIKKFMLPGGYEELTLARLQLAFIEKFAWHNAELPEIYIQDPISGVRHELEDLSDVKDRSVLVLNFEALDEVKKHFDEGIGGLKNTLEGVRSLLDGQTTMMQRFGDRQLEASKDMARLSATPTPRATRAPASDLSKIPSGSAPASEGQLQEVANLRRDIAVLRQSYSSMSADFSAAMKDIKAKAANVKAAAETAAVPTYEGNAGRVHVNEGKKTLMNDSEALVNRVDNLSDTVEDLRKDVVSRGVRPRPHDLEILSKEISAVMKDLSRVKEFMKREKPVWTKIWEQELNLVCTERDDLTQQEELMGDLFGDLEDVQNVFNLVEEAMKQQNLQGGTGGLRSTSKNIEIDPTLDPGQAKEGVLDEVRALRPNHEDRLEAIERAERQRRKDLESRKGNEFQKEVEQFVEEGKLKKTGGMDEVERLRALKDQRAFKENWATQQAIEAEKARKKAEREAAKKAAAAQAAAPSDQSGLSHTNGDRMHEPALVPPPVVVPSGGDGANDSNDTSQEGEPVFQDAPTGMTPQPMPAPEDPMATSAYALATMPVEQTQRPVQEDAPQLPQVDVGSETGKDDTKDQKSNGDSNSWWKPAVF